MITKNNKDDNKMILYSFCKKQHVAGNLFICTLKESDGQARASAHCASWKGPPGGRAGGLQAGTEEVLAVLLDGQA